MRLFRRDYRLVVGTFDLTNLDCDFTVTKTIKPEPNVCNLKLYGLAETTRHTLELVAPRGQNKTAEGIPVRLEAGYEGKRTLLYLGEVRNAQSTSSEGDIITELKSGDGEKAIQQNRISVPIGPNTDPATALGLVAKTLGVGAGNLAAAQTSLRASGKASLHPKGTAYYGSAKQALDDFCHSAGLEWSVQDGNLQILELGKALEGQAVVLSSDTGMVGSPSVDNKGIVTVKSLIIPDLRCGGKIQVKGIHVTGFYKITEITYTGKFYGTEWYAEVKGEAL